MCSFYDDEPDFNDVDGDDVFDENAGEDDAEAGDDAVVHSSAGGPVPSGGDAGGQPNAERITTPYMTKYEKARILGTRALQIRYVPRRRARTATDTTQHECTRARAYRGRD